MKNIRKEKNMEMCYEGTLVMPSNYVVMDSEEMSYVEGGFAIPNWLVGGAINWAISAAFGGLGSFCAMASKKAFSQAAKIIFAKEVKKQLIAKGIAYGAASVICGFIPSALTLIGAVCDPGGWLAARYDRRDSNPNNGWCNV
ncbi:MAG: hypothetical protein WAP07_04075 [Acutalibacteraceae bacterium]